MPTDSGYSGSTRPAPSAAELRYRANMPQPHDPTPRKWYHTTEVPDHVEAQQHAQSFRDRGIIGSDRSSFDTGKQVYAHPHPPEHLGPNQQYVEFETGDRPSGRGTSFMGRGGPSSAVSFGNDVPPSKVNGVFGHLPEGGIGRIADAASTTTGLMGLLGMVAPMIPGFANRMPRTTWLANGGPLGDLLQSVIAGNYAPGGVMDPYKDWAGSQPVSANGTVLA